MFQPASMFYQRESSSKSVLSKIFRCHQQVLYLGVCLGNCVMYPSPSIPLLLGPDLGITHVSAPRLSCVRTITSMAVEYVIRGGIMLS